MAKVALRPPLVVPEDLSGDLWVIVETTARIQGFTFSSGCKEEIKAFLNTGADRLGPESANGSHRREMLFKAVQDVVRIIEMMVKVSVNEGQSKVLESNIFERIKKFFCPCYPWC